MAQQSASGEEMLRNTEAALDLCRHVHRSTDEQRESGEHIPEVKDMMRGLSESAESIIAELGPFETVHGHVRSVETPVAASQEVEEG